MSLQIKLFNCIALLIVVFYSSNALVAIGTNAFILAQQAEPNGSITIANIVISKIPSNPSTINATFFGNNVIITEKENDLSEMRFEKPIEIQVTPWESAKIKTASLSLSNEEKELTFTAQLFSQTEPVTFTYDFATDSCAPVSLEKITYNSLLPNLLPKELINSSFNILTITLASPFTASKATLTASSSLDQIKAIMPCPLPSGDLVFSGSYGKSQGLLINATFKGNISIIPNIATISNVVFTIQQNPNDITSNTSIVLYGDGTLVIPGFGSPMHYKATGQVANGMFDYMQGIVQGPLTFVRVMNVNIVSFDKALVRISLTNQNILVRCVAPLLNDLVSTTSLEIKQIAPAGKLPYFYIQLSVKIISKTEQAIEEGGKKFFESAGDSFNSMGDTLGNTFKKLF